MTDKELFAAIRKIADMAYEYASADVGGEPWLEDRRGERVNPYYNQTESGVFLEMYYGIPGKLWTPWGSWNCWGSGSGYGGEYDRMLERLGAVEHTPETISTMGVFGPVYALTSVDGDPLPEAVVRDRQKFIDSKAIDAAWETMLADS